MMTLFGKDFVRSLVLGFAVGTAAMVAGFSAESARAAVPAAGVAMEGQSR